MERIGSGKGVAALLNGRAKRMTPKAVRALRHALPDALILVSEDFDQARRHVQHIVRETPDVLLSGGGDGAAMKVLNLWREEGHGKPIPPLGLLKLGTGNAWANVVGTPDYFDLVKELPNLPRPLPTTTFNLVEVEKHLCHFAGVGWDARILNDYLTNLDKRSSQLVASRVATAVHKGLPGYMYSLFRITIPEEWSLLRNHGQARVTLENLGEPCQTVDESGRVIRHTAESPVLFEGPVSVGAAATTPEWGFGFRAFPFARARPGMLNVRIYDRPVLEATRNMMHLWRGRHPQPGMHDFFVTKARMRFSRPMPFQIGGDGLGVREEVEYLLAPETASVVDWTAARGLAS